MASDADKFVCRECVRDEDLQELVDDSATSTYCSYCGKRSDEPIGAPLEVITERIWECASEDYVNPVEELPYETREGGWQGQAVHIPWEVLFEEIGLEIEDEELMQDIADSSPEPEWTKRDWVLLDPHQRQLSGWEKFKHAVKHQRRFTFWTMGDPVEDPHHPDALPVSKMLDEIQQAIQEMGLVSTLPIGARFWRVRIHDIGANPESDRELGPPPVELATQPNRMSPGGVPMFYASEDLDTALIETFAPSRRSGKAVTAACFASFRDLRILDLYDLPPIPGYFSGCVRDARETMCFLRQFSADIAQPIERNGREHIAYVPTQAFTEFVRFGMDTADGQPIDGIRYRSSRNGRPCNVLFCEQDNCCEPEPHSRAERVLQLVTEATRHLSEQELSDAVARLWPDSDE